MKSIIILLCVCFILCLCSLVLVSKQPVVDLPEEYKAISHDQNKPDTLVGYFKDGTLFIQFK